MGFLNFIACKCLPIFIACLAIFIGVFVRWLFSHECPECVLFKTVIPVVSKGQLPETLFGPFNPPHTPVVPDDMKPEDRPSNEMFLTLPDGDQMPANGLGMCCRASAYDGETVYRSVLHYLLMGGRHIDTAHMYLNHEACGRAINDAISRGIPRAEIFVTTKIPNSFFGFDSAKKLVPRYLKELGLDYIDLLLLHHPKPPFPPVTKTAPECVQNNFTDSECRIDTWTSLSKNAYDTKLVKNLGVSNFNKGQMQELQSLGLAPIAANQFQYNPFAPSWRHDVFDFCQKNNIAVTAWASLAGTMMETSKILNVDVLKGIAEKYNKRVASILLRWPLQLGASVIPGSGNPKHMRENLGVYDFELSEVDMNTLNAIRDSPRANDFSFEPELADD